jgi:hypothetical protein
MNKKAQVAKTLQWAVATIIIFFIMLFFAIFSGAIFIKGGASKDISFYFNSNTSFVKTDFDTFLQTPITFQEKNILVKDLIVFGDLNGNEIYLEEFKRLAEIFYYASIEKRVSSSSWIRIYGADEFITKDLYGKYGEYAVDEKGKEDSNLIIGLIGKNCDPQDENSFVLEYLISKDKKVVLCLD